MEARLNRSMAGLAIAFACGAAAAAGTIAMLSSPAQAITPGQQAGPQQHGGQSSFKVVSFEGKSAQHLQNLLTAESAGGWRFAQMSGNLVILTR